MRHCGVTAWLVISIAVQLFQLYAGLQSRTGYYYAYRDTAWISNFAFVCLIAGVHYRAVVHFGHPVRVAAGTVAILGGVATVLAYELAGAAVDGRWDRSIGEILANRGNVMLGVAVFVLLSRVIFRAMTHCSLSINAGRAMDAVALLAGGTWVIYAVSRLGAPTRLENYATVALHMSACVVWMLMHESGDAGSPPVNPIAPASLFRAVDREFEKMLGKKWRRD